MPGTPASARLLPSDAPLRLFSTVGTAPRDSNINDIHYTRVFPTDSVVLTGRLAAGHAPVRIEAAVLDPTLYFERALTQVLRESGIVVSGGTTDTRNLTPDTVFTWTSPTLVE